MRLSAYANIHFDHLKFNFHNIQRAIAPARLIPVVKADAYGHGAVAVSTCLVSEGASFLAVAQFKEAMELRDSGIMVPILVFGRLFPEELPDAIRAGIRVSVFGEEDLQWIERCGADQPAHVHVKMETGMGRVGVLPSREAAVFDKLAQSPQCIWEGIYSHFATADEKDKTYTHDQLRRFQEIIGRVERKKQRPPMVHISNSGAILDMPEARFDACRSGIMLYGHYPSRETGRQIVLKQVMSLHSRVAHIRRLPAGHNVSYARRWQTERETTIAVLPIGYADGLRRHLTGRMQVMIGSKSYPVVGTITMDQTMVDVGDDPVRVGDEVLIWGDGPDGSIQAIDVAEAMGTIPYELTCGVSSRVRRVVVE